MGTLRGDVKIPTYKPHTNHKRSSVSSHTLAPTTICDLSHYLYWSPLTDLGHISAVTYVCHPLWFVCGHRKGILTSPLRGGVKIHQGPSQPFSSYCQLGHITLPPLTNLGHGGSRHIMWYCFHIILRLTSCLFKGACPY